MKTMQWKELRKKKLTPKQLAEVDRKVDIVLLQMELRELRELVGKTQQEVAGTVDVSQSQLSRFELREDHLLSKLRRYIEALGGRLEVVAVLGNKRVTLRGV